MNLNQIKLSRSEWDSIEVPVSPEELSVVTLIKEGYDNVNIRKNNGKTIFTFLKINYNPDTYSKIEEHLFNEYLRKYVDKIEHKILKIDSEYEKINVCGISRLNSTDKIRLEKNSTIDESKAYEYILLKHSDKLLYNYISNNAKQTTYHFYTLFKMIDVSVLHLNKYVFDLCKYILCLIEPHINITTLVENAVEIIETNKNLLKFNDMKLYEHQKRIFTVCKRPSPKLILYTAPTGTGKTLTPIGLSEQHRVIFVCVARHVGLALARSAISVGKKVAFAFGCASADDIRLHYYAAKEYTKNKRTGGIGKVDNSVGDNVEIIICDIKSYLVAMYYMLAFNERENIIMYWDEPTITMDYETHEFHDYIKNSWSDNKIPNIVLSSATLPKVTEIQNVINDFKHKTFTDEGVVNVNPTVEYIVENIVSYDCKKSIPIINNLGYTVLPHSLSEDYSEIETIVKHCEDNKSLIRYMDLKEIVKFIIYVNENNFTRQSNMVQRKLESVEAVDLVSIKMYYLHLLKNIKSGTWGAIALHMKLSREPKLVPNNSIDCKGNRIIRKITSVDTSRNIISSEPNTNDTTVGIYITTKDAYTLTDGPTIYICENIQKIASFCIQQSNIPSTMMAAIMSKIQYNNIVNEKIKTVEQELESKQDEIEKNSSNITQGKSKSKGKSNKINREMNNHDGKSDISRLTNELNGLRSMIKSAVLNDMFIPNTGIHLDKWAKKLNTNNNSFSSRIDEHIVNDIMALNGIEDSWKVLLMMGIGVFINHPNKAYTEIMKQLADEQKLFLIIASSDYIYGTNYQFCHAYLAKDLDLTQEKIIQAMGRVGRSNIQQTYTLRFRDNNQILKLFTNDVDKPEVRNMNNLLVSSS